MPYLKFFIHFSFAQAFLISCPLLSAMAAVGLFDQGFEPPRHCSQILVTPELPISASVLSPLTIAKMEAPPKSLKYTGRALTTMYKGELLTADLEVRGIAFIESEYEEVKVRPLKNKDSFELIYSQLTDLKMKGYYGNTNDNLVSAEGMFLPENIWVILQFVSSYFEGSLVTNESYVIEDTQSGEVVGTIHANFKNDSNEFLLSYQVFTQFQKKGFGYRALIALINGLHQRSPEYPIYLTIRPENTGSIQLAEKVGFIVHTERSREDSEFIWYTLP